MTLWIGTDQGLFADDQPVAALASTRVKCLATEDNAVWAATDDALWKHTDQWREIAAFPADVRPRCLLPVESGLLVGTSGAQVYRLVDGVLACDEAFAGVATRSLWHTPWGGPPSTWTMCGGPSAEVWANVHVGGLVRSTDNGRNWTQTPLDIEVDVHQVNRDANGFVVATARGFGHSVDGEEWEFDNDGLHAHYLRSVATTRDHIFVSASSGPRSEEVAIYRRARGSAEFQRSAPADGWLRDNVDAPALATSGAEVAFGTLDGRVFQSLDEGDSWSVFAEGLPPVQSVLITH